MILFFKSAGNIYYVTEVSNKPEREVVEKLQWLFGNAEIIETEKAKGIEYQLLCLHKGQMVEGVLRSMAVTYDAL